MNVHACFRMNVITRCNEYVPLVEKPHGMAEARLYAFHQA